MVPIDRELSRVSYDHARAHQERTAARLAADERSRQVHLHLALIYEIRSVLGEADDQASRTGPVFDGPCPPLLD